jgi:hypothetical protein
VHTPRVGLSQIAFADELEASTSPPAAGLGAPVTVTRRTKLAVAVVLAVTFVKVHVRPVGPPAHAPLQPVKR